MLDFLSRVWRRPNASAPSSNGARKVFRPVSSGDIAPSKEAASDSSAPPSHSAPPSSQSPPPVPERADSVLTTGEVSTDPLLSNGTFSESGAIETVLPDGSPSSFIAATEAAEVNMDAHSLGSRTMKGAGLAMVSAIASQIAGVVRTVVLARLLSQDDFGVAAMTLTISGALFTLTNTGVIGSVISARFRTEKELHRYANVVWTLEAARGVAIGAFIALGAWPFAHFYREPRLFPVLLLMTLQPFLLAPFNIGLMLQERQLKMKQMLWHGLWTSLLTVGITLLLAFLTRNYWAIIWGQVLGALVGTAFSYVLFSYRPRLEWHWPLVRQALDFGKHQFVIGLCNYVLTTMDNVLVGFMFHTVALGIYTVAYSFCTMARQVATSAFSTVLFPAFASAGREDDPARLRSLVERSFTLGMAGLTAFLVPLIVYSPAIMRIFFARFGTLPVEPMRWLLVAGWFTGLLALFNSFFVGLGRPQFESKYKFLDAVVFVAILVPLTRAHGIVGAAQAGALTWALSSLWRLRAAGALVPGAFGRLPSLMVSSVIVGMIATVVGLWPFAGRAVFSLAGFVRAFHPAIPSLGTAWLQLLVASPLLALGCTAGLMALHPVARTEIPALARRLLGRRLASAR